MQLTTRRLSPPLAWLRHGPQVPTLWPGYVVNTPGFSLTTPAEELGLLNYDRNATLAWFHKMAQRADFTLDRCLWAVGIVSIVLEAVACFAAGTLKSNLAIAGLVGFGLLVVLWTLLAVRRREMTFGPAGDRTVSTMKFVGMPQHMLDIVEEMSQKWRDASAGFPLIFLVRYVKRPFRSKKYAWVLALSSVDPRSEIVVAVDPIPEHVLTKASIDAMPDE